MINHEAAFGLSEATIRLSYSFSLGPITWSIEPGDRWLVLGENGAGKSAMLSALSGMGDCVSGDRAVPSQCAVVSSGFQNALIEEEIALEQGDLSGQVVDGTKAASILHQIEQDARVSISWWTGSIWVVCSIKRSAPFPRARHENYCSPGRWRPQPTH